MPGQLRRNGEDQIQMAIAAALDAAGVLWMHTPNEGRCSIQEAKRRKARGVKAGVPDVLIFTPPYSYNGAALELKAPKGRASAEQQDWLDRLSDAGWATAVVYGLDEAREKLREWGYLR
jgi:hypothetical protein